MWLPGALLLVLATRSCVSERQDWLQEVRNESYHILKCGKKSYCTRPVASDTEFDARCHCDPECTVFRDCCVDRAVRDADVVPGGVVRGIDVNNWGCGLLGYSLSGLKSGRTPQNVSMVMGCPEGHALSSLCSRRPAGGSGSYSYLLDVAVLGQTTGLWYRNLYCAACHGDLNLRPYRPTVSCNFEDFHTSMLLQDGRYVEGGLAWLFSNGSKCELKLTLNTTGQEDVGWLRSCPLDMVSECPANEQDPDLAEKCRSYALFSLDQQDEGQLSPAYKNPHCALCHGAQPKCWPFITIRTQTSGPSLMVVLDMSWERSRPEVSWNCTLPHGLWDVLHGRCLELGDVCPAGLSLDGDLCVPVEPREGLVKTCVKITLLRHEYRDLQGGGVVLNSSLFAVYEAHVFREGQFERLTNGSLSICHSLLQEVHDELVFYSSAAQVYITIMCLSVSILCLALHIATYCLLPKLCNLPGKNLVALSWALLLGQLLFLVGVQPVVDVPHGVCMSVVLAIQYFLLAAFCWMNIMSLDIWRTFSSSLGHANSSRTFRKYSAYAWGIPAVLSAATLAADVFGPGVVSPHLASSRGFCWFGSRTGQAVFFTAPIVAVLVGNAVLFGMTVYQLHRHTRDNYRYIRRKNKEELSATLSRSSTGYQGGPSSTPKPPSTRGGVAGSRDETRLYLYLKLFVVMGMTWLFGFLATLANIPVLMYPFLVLNGMQGAFIFFMFDMKRSIGRMLWERVVGRRRASPAFLESRTGGNNNSSSNQSVAKKKISQTSTSSSLLSSGAFRPISSIVHERDVVGVRASTLSRPDEAVELIGCRTSNMALLPQKPPPDSCRLQAGGGVSPAHWLHKLPQSEVT